MVIGTNTPHPPLTVGEPRRIKKTAIGRACYQCRPQILALSAPQSCTGPTRLEHVLVSRCTCPQMHIPYGPAWVVWGAAGICRLQRGDPPGAGGDCSDPPAAAWVAAAAPSCAAISRRLAYGGNKQARATTAPTLDAQDATPEPVVLPTRYRRQQRPGSGGDDDPPGGGRTYRVREKLVMVIVMIAVQQRG